MTTKITEEQVFNACKLLVSQNKRVTVDAVRYVVGSGSKSTLTPMVRKWREQNPEVAYDSKQLIPMPNEVMGKYNEIWTLAVRHAEQTIDNEFIAVLEAENERLKAELMEYEKLKVETKTLKETQDKLFEALQKTNEKNGQLEARIQELESKK